MESTISIITACFNSCATLKWTMDSVLMQDYAHIEHIIIDNESSDGTHELIQNYRQKYQARNINFIFISERDKGVYDAMNKGLARASGEIVGFLNADDFFVNEKIVSIIASAFEDSDSRAPNSHKNLDSRAPNSRDTNTTSSHKNLAQGAPQIIYANVMYVDKNLKPFRILKGEKMSRGAFQMGFHPAHPSFYAKREIYKKFGNFDLSYKIAADYEIMLRMLIKHELKSLYIDEVFVKMRTGGLSNASFRNILKANLESARAWRKNKLSAFPIFIIFKPLRKLFGINYKNAFTKLIQN